MAAAEQKSLLPRESHRLSEDEWKRLAERSRTIFTIGHSTRPLADLIRVLHYYGVERLADIRHFPSSRHNPQFNQVVLREALNEASIEYCWIQKLGGYRHQGYRTYMETEDFAAGLRELKNLANQKRTACMCAELKWWQCHRRRVAGVLAGKSWSVIHIFDESRAETHFEKTNRIRCD